LVARLTKDSERTTEAGITVTSTCLAHCYRGGPVWGVLWTVWERTFDPNLAPEQSAERWITCSLLRYQARVGWGYMDIDERMFPFQFSCPLSYLEMVPLDQHGGHAEWREQVRDYHDKAREQRQTGRAAA
jgi:hypothetical protein